MNASVMWVMSLYGGMIFLNILSFKIQSSECHLYKAMALPNSSARKAAIPDFGQGVCSDLMNWYETIKRIRSREFVEIVEIVEFQIRELLSKIECQDCTDHSPLMLIHGLAQQSYAKAKTKKFLRTLGIHPDTREFLELVVIF